MAADNSDSEPTDEAGPMPSLNRPQQTRPHRHGSSPGSRDFNTGRCMTCGSLVRWPKDLQLFKCSICLTINSTSASSSQELARPSESKDETSVESTTAPRPPLSTEHTKSLVAQCLRSFLLQTLAGKRQNVAGHQAPSETMSPRSSSRGGNTDGPADIPPPLNQSTPTPLDGVTETIAQLNPFRRPPDTTRSYSTSHTERRPSIHAPRGRGAGLNQSSDVPSLRIDSRRIFRPLEDYVIDSFFSFQCLNSSFSSHRGAHQIKPSRDVGQRHHVEPRKEVPQPPDYTIADVDAKLLLLGDVAENGAWWTGGQEESVPGRSTSVRAGQGQSLVTARSPRLDWADLDDWYKTVVEAGHSWPEVYSELVSEDPTLTVSPMILGDIEAQILAGQEHAQKTLLKASEGIMKNPGRPMTGPHELRFLLILAANPLLHASYKPYAGEFDHADVQTSSPPRGNGPVSGRHSGIIKRIVGLLSNTSPECQSHLVHWFARYPEPLFIQFKDLVSGFLAYRLIRQHEKKQDRRVDIIDQLVPSMGAGRSVASLHAALVTGQLSGSIRRQKQKKKKIIYQDDWQIKAAAQVLGFLFAANNIDHARRPATSRVDSGSSNRERVKTRGQVVVTSDFYTTLLDDSDLVGDFEAWEQKKAKFTFCQFPFLLSVGAKIQILEYDARRQMDNRARNALFASLSSTALGFDSHLTLNVRRDCLVDDSLKAVSEVIGGDPDDIKKGLRIIFRGEEGIDAGGLRKEWFLLLVREVFNPDHGTFVSMEYPALGGDKLTGTGMFIYDEDSQHCYFNPNALEPSEQFFLVGVVFGLAIHNSIILDVALPPFAFRKLLMAAPPSAMATSQPRQAMTYTLDDLAEYRPRLAHGLRQLLDYDGDVEATFSLDFAIDTDKYGATEKVLLCPNGDRRAVTNANRRDYVDLYTRYLLDTAVARQFEPFKRGFFTVCGGNALSLFRPEEIELLVRGSDEALDIGSLRAVAVYDGWTKDHPVVGWFWNSFERAPPADQRKLLSFITGSDRIPAMGAASLTIRVVCLGEDKGRFPTASTCFNSLSLWKYGTRERLEEMLWTAVRESEGFGLK